MKLKTALADLRDALQEYAEIEGIEEEKVDPQNRLVKELIAHGKHKNLSFFAFTATPKDTTLEMFGEQDSNGQFHPFHIYSMHQAIEEGFILDVLQNYMTYKTCFKIVNSTPENPEVPTSRASKVIKKYQQLHPENIRLKAEIIVETFMGTTRGKINGKSNVVQWEGRLADSIASELLLRLPARPLPSHYTTWAMRCPLLVTGCHNHGVFI